MFWFNELKERVELLEKDQKEITSKILSVTMKDYEDMCKKKLKKSGLIIKFIYTGWWFIACIINPNAEHKERTYVLDWIKWEFIFETDDKYDLSEFIMNVYRNKYSWNKAK